MKDIPLASIIVNNYNYGSFLKDAIDSALNQTYSNLEVVVVDDGSTDNSREVIASYGQRIIPFLKENEGQASAFNAGFEISRGEVIIFLDADDMLLPTAMEEAVKTLQNPAVVKVHWYLWEIDKQGRKTGRKHPYAYPLAEGDLRQDVIAQGLAGKTISPTSGNAWKRSFIKLIYPVPNGIWVDGYLSRLAAIFGQIKLLSEPQGYYRIHGSNHAASSSLSFKIRRTLEMCDIQFPLLCQYLQQKGVFVNPETWKVPGMPYERLKKKLELLEAIELSIPVGESLIFIDEQIFKRELLKIDFFPRHNFFLFRESDGQYLGAPPDSETAIKELEKLQQAGANFIVFVWPSFWWLEYYHKFNDYLLSHHNFIANTDACKIFHLDLKIK